MAVIGNQVRILPSKTITNGYDVSGRLGNNDLNYTLAYIRQEDGTYACLKVCNNGVSRFHENIQAPLGIGELNEIEYIENVFKKIVSKETFRVARQSPFENILFEDQTERKGLHVEMVNNL